MYLEDLNSPSKSFPMMISELSQPFWFAGKLIFLCVYTGGPIQLQPRRIDREKITGKTIGLFQKQYTSNAVYRTFISRLYHFQSRLTQCPKEARLEHVLMRFDKEQTYQLEQLEHAYSRRTGNQNAIANNDAKQSLFCNLCSQMLYIDFENYCSSKQVC